MALRMPQGWDLLWTCLKSQSPQGFLGIGRTLYNGANWESCSLDLYGWYWLESDQPLEYLETLNAGNVKLCCLCSSHWGEIFLLLQLSDRTLPLVTSPMGSSLKEKERKFSTVKKRRLQSIHQSNSPQKMVPNHHFVKQNKPTRLQCKARTLIWW